MHDPESGSTKRQAFLLLLFEPKIKLWTQKLLTFAVENSLPLKFQNLFLSKNVSELSDVNMDRAAATYK